MAAFGGSQTFEGSTKVFVVRFTPFARSVKSSNAAQAIRFSPNSTSPDIVTEMMHSALDDIQGIKFYMDDIGVFSLTWPNHLFLLSTVLGRLENVGFTINLSK